MDRRALRARPRALDFGFAGRERLVLRCWLPRGVFMTALLAALGPVAEG
ncbi:MAG: hypothetical protein RML12_08590 [Xanthomonadales bacterium]|nr:hypothetical protein [Xanthomonadales bacterium]